MTRAIIERLPKLRLIASTAMRNASIDLKAAEERGVQVVHTGYTSAPTIELTWALILASARNLVAENTSLRGGGWQQSVGDDMAGRTLGLLGLGNVGGAVAQIGNAFGMKVIAWSQNLTTERAAEVGATLRLEGRAVPRGGCRLHPSGAQRQDARPRRRRGTGAHEADGAPHKHFARTDRGRGRSRLRRLKTKRSLAQPSMSSTRSRCRSTIRSAACRTCWRRRISATSPAGCTSASTRTRSRTFAVGSIARQRDDHKFCRKSARLTPASGIQFFFSGTGGCRSSSLERNSLRIGEVLALS